jgi:hypothetical protein
VKWAGGVRDVYFTIHANSTEVESNNHNQEDSDPNSGAGGRIPELNESGRSTEFCWD